MLVRILYKLHRAAVLKGRVYGSNPLRNNGIIRSCGVKVVHVRM